MDSLLKWIIGILIFIVIASQMGFIDLGNLFSSASLDMGVSPSVGGLAGGGA